ncbi:MAG: hypothetical protein QOE68_4483 [Thermoanaerobaculia bacterium]|jgi:hypothetical protein|nr:hypothetical protein [Thermoanaerobaculia bacterium]
MTYKFQISGDLPITVDGVVPTTNQAPTVIQFGAYVYVFFSGHDPGNPSLWQLAWNPSAGWIGNDRVSFGNSSWPQTANSPAAAIIGSTLYLAWWDVNTATIQLASAGASDGPTSATGWSQVPVSAGSAPNNSDTGPGIAMIAYPYQNVDSLWFFYMNGIYLAYAIAQPNDAGGVDWVANVGSISTDNGIPVGNASPAATVAPLTAGGDAAPYVVFVGSGSAGDLSYVVWNGAGFSGNEHLKLPPSHFVEQTPQTNRPPCLLSLANKTASMILLYKGRHTNDILLSVYAYGDQRWQLNMDMAMIPGAGGKPVLPETDLGMGAVVYNDQLVMVYPSSKSPGGQELYFANVDYAISS